MSEDVYNCLEAHADQEIEAGLIPQYTCLQCVIATRTDVSLPELEDGEEEEEEEEEGEDLEGDVEEL